MGSRALLGLPSMLYHLRLDIPGELLRTSHLHDSGHVVSSAQTPCGVPSIPC